PVQKHCEHFFGTLRGVSGAFLELQQLSKALAFLKRKTFLLAPHGRMFNVLLPAQTLISPVTFVTELY
ncbi:MAG: hypothetical protein Q7V05_01900, partial [Methanoregula sp.]|nr:hypothetical protein [Methanoregula sp.]